MTILFDSSPTAVEMAQTALADKAAVKLLADRRRWIIDARK